MRLEGYLVMKNSGVVDVRDLVGEVSVKEGLSLELG
jgi:hypothetical protein